MVQDACSRQPTKPGRSTPPIRTTVRLLPALLPLPTTSWRFQSASETCGADICRVLIVAETGNLVDLSFHDPVLLRFFVDENQGNCLDERTLDASFFTQSRLPGVPCFRDATNPIGINMVSMKQSTRGDSMHGDNVSISEYFRVVFDSRRLVCAVALGTFALGAFYGALNQPMYRADALVQIGTQTSSSSDTEALG